MNATIRVFALVLLDRVVDAVEQEDVDGEEDGLTRHSHGLLFGQVRMKLPNVIAPSGKHRSANSDETIGSDEPNVYDGHWAWRLREN